MFNDIQDCNIISSCDVLSCGFENWLTQFGVFFIGIGEKNSHYKHEFLEMQISNQ